MTREEQQKLVGELAPGYEVCTKEEAKDADGKFTALFRDDLLPWAFDTGLDGNIKECQYIWCRKRNREPRMTPPRGFKFVDKPYVIGPSDDGKYMAPFYTPDGRLLVARGSDGIGAFIHVGGDWRWIAPEGAQEPSQAQRLEELERRLNHAVRRLGIDFHVGDWGRNINEHLHRLEKRIEEVAGGVRDLEDRVSDAEEREEEPPKRAHEPSQAAKPEPEDASTRQDAWDQVSDLAQLAQNTPPERREGSSLRRAVLLDRQRTQADCEKPKPTPPEGYEFCTWEEAERDGEDEETRLGLYRGPSGEWQNDYWCNDPIDKCRLLWLRKAVKPEPRRWSSPGAPKDNAEREPRVWRARGEVQRALVDEPGLVVEEPGGKRFTFNRDRGFVYVVDGELGDASRMDHCFAPWAEVLPKPELRHWSSPDGSVVYEEVERWSSPDGKVVYEEVERFEDADYAGVFGGEVIRTHLMGDASGWYVHAVSNGSYTDKWVRRVFGGER